MTKNLSKSLGIEYKNLTQSEQEIVSGIKKKLTTNELQKIISERVYHKWKRNSQVCNKLLILGATDSGKTAFLERYVNNHFKETLPTVGAYYLLKTEEMTGLSFQHQIWDTPGIKRFRFLLPMWTRNAKIVLQFFSLTDPLTWEEIQSCHDEIKQNWKNKIRILVGTKSDLIEKREIPINIIEEYCIKNKTKYFECSSKTGENIQVVMDYLTRYLCEEVRTATYPNFTWMDTSESYYSKICPFIKELDFYDLFRSKIFCDGKIKKIPVHKFFLEKRLSMEFKKIVKTLENIPKETINIFLNWAYGKTQYPNKEVTSLLSKHFNITDPEDLDLSRTLNNLYNDEESKDFKLLVKINIDGENIEQEKEEFKEIPIHKFVLLARSGLFRNIFQNIKKKYKKINQIKDYTGKSIESFEFLIKFFYTNSIKFTADDNQELVIEELADAKEYYQLNPKSSLNELLKK